MIPGASPPKNRIFGQNKDKIPTQKAKPEIQKAETAPVAPRKTFPTAPLLVTMLLVGVYEEVLFRGIVFYGFDKKFGKLVAVLASSVLFGAMHYVNWVTGQELASTHHQVIHAAGMGLMYAGLRLHLGTIIFPILLHGYWDATVFLFGTLISSETAASANDSAFVSLFLRYFDAAYGVLLVGLWFAWNCGSDKQAA